MNKMNTTSQTLQSEKIKEQYEAEGFVSGLQVFSDEEIQRFRSQFDKLEEELGKETCSIGLKQRHLTDQFIWEMASHPRLTEMMRAIMGEDILLLATHFFCKYPEKNPTTYVAWHQDTLYWGLEPPVAHTAWIALDDSDIENGAMRVIPGSHKEGLLPHGTAREEGNLLKVKNQAISTVLFNVDSAIDLELKAGQMSVHHGYTIHGSNPNRSNRRRCGLTVRYITPDVRQADKNSRGDIWEPILISGNDRFGNFTLHPKPSF